jgi:hypothetical protein
MFKAKHFYSFGNLKISMNRFPSSPSATVTHRSPELPQNSLASRAPHRQAGQGSSILRRSIELIQYSVNETNLNISRLCDK